MDKVLAQYSDLLVYWIRCRDSQQIEDRLLMPRPNYLGAVTGAVVSGFLFLSHIRQGALAYAAEISGTQ